MPQQDHSSRSWLVAALAALDREGDLVAAAYVAMALARVDERVDQRVHAPNPTP